MTWRQFIHCHNIHVHSTSIWISVAVSTFLYKFSRQRRNAPWPNLGMTASAIHCRSMLQARRGRWGCLMWSGAREGCPSDNITSTRSWKNTIDFFMAKFLIMIRKKVTKYDKNPSWVYLHNVHSNVKKWFEICIRTVQSSFYNSTCGCVISCL